MVPIILKYENGITEITFDNSKKLLDYAEYLLEHLQDIIYEIYKIFEGDNEIINKIKILEEKLKEKVLSSVDEIKQVVKDWWHKIFNFK